MKTKKGFSAKVRSPGFTLIELLVAVSILGILSVIGLVMFSNTQAKARDSKRVRDLQQIQVALEQYYQDNGSYPAYPPGLELLRPKYLTAIPSDPKDSGSFRYIYTALPTGCTNNCIGYQITGGSETASNFTGTQDSMVAMIASSPGVSTPTPSTPTTPPSGSLTPAPSVSPVSSPAPTSPPGTADLDVAYISRTPRYDRYNVCYSPNPTLCGGQTSADKRWPAAGDTVTFTAKVVNHGPDAAGAFAYKWFIDGVEVNQGNGAGIAVGSSKSFDYSWVWQNGDHKVKLIADTNNQVTETSKVNNNLEDYTNSLVLRIHVEQGVYDKFNAFTNFRGTKSYEDWVQGQMDKMRTNIVAAGTNERVRIDEIVIETDGSLPRGGTHAPVNWAWDGSWGFETTEWTAAKIQSEVGAAQGTLIHEWGHQLGLIDSYNLNYDWNYVRANLAIPICQSCDITKGACGDLSKYQICVYYNPNLRGQMGDTNLVPFSSFDAGSLKSNLGKRRGFFGEYLYDIPDTNTVQIIDSTTSTPITSAQLSFYQDSGCNTLPSTVVFSGTTDSNGRFTLPNQAATSVTTATGHTQKNNPFGTIGITGCNGIFLIKVEKGGNLGYTWLDISSFNLAYWSGQTTSAQYQVKVTLSSILGINSSILNNFDFSKVVKFVQSLFK